jgi:hypothetical protein
MGVFELVDIVTYLGESVVLSYSHRLKDWETALELYDKIKKANIHPSDMMAFHLLSTVGTSGKLDRLLKVSTHSPKAIMNQGAICRNFSFKILTGFQTLYIAHCLWCLTFSSTLAGVLTATGLGCGTLCTKLQYLDRQLCTSSQLAEVS